MWFMNQPMWFMNQPMWFIKNGETPKMRLVSGRRSVAQPWHRDSTFTRARPTAVSSQPSFKQTFVCDGARSTRWMRTWIYSRLPAANVLAVGSAVVHRALNDWHDRSEDVRCHA